MLGIKVHHGKSCMNSGICMDDDNVFKKYKTTTSNDLGNIISSIKNINMNNVKKNLNSIEKGIKLLQDFVKKEDVMPTYTPRPIFKKFED